MLPDGSARPGGTAFYSALQAARLGKRALIITRGAPAVIEDLLAPFRTELELEVHPAAQTTTLQTLGAGPSRTQRLLAWAGPIGESINVDTAILHLAPVARETAPRWKGFAEFIGLTPQGLVRAWAGEGDVIEQVPLERSLLPERCDAIVISRAELGSCAALMEALVSPSAGERAADGDLAATDPVPQPGTVVAVTAEAAAITLHHPGGQIDHVEVPAVDRVVEDVGAGDVFAAALFVALHERQPPRAAAAIASAAAAVRLGGAGASAIGGMAAIGARIRALA